MNDTDLHMTAGALIACSTALLFYRFTHLRIILCLGIALITGTTIGIMKEEIYDRQMKRGTPSTPDKINTGYGSAVGVIISIPIIQTNEQRIDEREKFQNLSDSMFIKIKP